MKKIEGLGDWEEGKEEYCAEKLIENWQSWESRELNGQKRNEDKTCEDWEVWVRN